MLKKAKNSRTRRVSEIYFVLYLAALILLLPGKNEKKSHQAIDAITSIFQQSFSILPEKNSLLSRLTIDSTGSTVLQLDTSNVMLVTGNVRDVELECSVEDQDIREVVFVEKQGGQHFSLNYDATKKLVFFSWHPPQSLLSGSSPSKNYVVTVKATAKPNIGPENPELQELLRSAGAVLRTEAKFSISILTEGIGNTMPRIVYMPAETTFQRITMVERSNNSEQFTANQFNSQSASTQEFTMQPMIASIKTIAAQQWNNKVFITGINSSLDFLTMPTLRIERNGGDNTGNAEITDIRAGELQIRGFSPSISIMKIFITGKRKSDKKEVTTEFTVQPQALAVPTYPKVMYPGIRYTFSPQMPVISNVDIRAVLRFGKKELLNSPQGMPFTFTPEIEDTGSTYIFERQINGKAIGQFYTTKIEAYPAPDLLNESIANGVIKINTRSFGLANSKDNRVTLTIKDGTANNTLAPRELFGNYQADRAGLVFIQQFEIRPKDPKKPFSCTVRAIDQFGKISGERLIRSD